MSHCQHSYNTYNILSEDLKPQSPWSHTLDKLWSIVFIQHRSHGKSLSPGWHTSLEACIMKSRETVQFIGGHCFGFVRKPSDFRYPHLRWLYWHLEYIGDKIYELLYGWFGMSYRQNKLWTAKVMTVRGFFNGGGEKGHPDLLWMNAG